MCLKVGLVGYFKRDCRLKSPVRLAALVRINRSIRRPDTHSFTFAQNFKELETGHDSC
jgi:hypothetical protein